MATSPGSPGSDASAVPPAQGGRGAPIESTEANPAEIAGEGLPFLPTVPVVPSATHSSVADGTPPPQHGESPASPFIPEAVRVAPEPVEPAPFDAKAMVESQKRINANPAYGTLPTSTEASREAANQLRAKAQRVRQRNKRIGWFVGVALLGGVAAAGWYAYRAYQDEQDQAAIERAENAASDERGQVDAASPLGQQVEVIDALDDTNAGAIVADDLLPTIVLEAGQRFPDATGRETYVISADQFAAGDPAAFGTFVRLLSMQPQIGPTAPVFDTLPTVAADEIVISVDRDGDELRRAIVWGADAQIYVDYAP